MNMHDVLMSIIMDDIILLNPASWDKPGPSQGARDIPRIDVEPDT